MPEGSDGAVSICGLKSEFHHRTLFVEPRVIFMCVCVDNVFILHVGFLSE
jgi:hypothetical protein